MKTTIIRGGITTLISLALASAQTTTVWNPAGNGIYPPTVGNWQDAANWTNGLPNGDYKAVFNVTNAAECDLTGTVNITHLSMGDNGPGGILRLKPGANLTTTDWSGHYNHSGLLIVEAGATAHFQTRLLLGQIDNPGSFNMELRMEGGSVTVEDMVRFGESFDSSNVSPRLQLNGGTLTADRLEMNHGTTDLSGGTLLLRVDHSTEIQSYIDAGTLTAHGGAGTVIHDWDSTTSGHLTVTAAPGTNIHSAQPTVSGPGSEGYHTTESSLGKQVWVAGNMLYFNLPTGLFPVGQPAYVRIEYLDQGQGYLTVKYDSDYGSTIEDKFRRSEVHTRSSRVDSGGFAYSYHRFDNPRFANRQNGGNDFRVELADNDGLPFRVASVQVSSTPFANPDFEYALTRPWLLPYTGPSKDFTDPRTLSGKVMTGYQGWFATPNDLGDRGWVHWSRGSGVGPSPTEVTIDMWPWLEDYGPGDVYPAGNMLHEDGRPAYVFSSRNPDVVQRHFRWMRKHNIDGAYLQRFVTRQTSGYFGANEFVLDNVRKAANAEGRVWAIEYDVSSMSNDPDPFEVITNDWNWLVNEADILNDPRYLHENGKPVLFIWGFSVPGREGLSLSEANAILDWFNTQDLYLIAGVHSSWAGNTAWHGHYQKYDQLLAWMEQSLSDLNQQKALLDSWGMKILPHAWPGFSWHNLKKLQPDTQYTPRDGGDFYWTRLYNAISCGADQIFLGMFDEYDEGTAIMPMSDNHPAPHTAWGKYIDNEGLDPFYYLQLSGAARECLHGMRPLSSSTPAPSSLTPAAFGGADATIHLGTANTSTGLTHPQPPDGQTSGGTRDGYDYRINAAANYFYFDLDDALAFAASEGTAASLEVEFFDDVPGSLLRLQYDGLSAPYTLHPTTVDPPDSLGWKTIRWQIPDGYFGNRQNGGSDFRLSVTGCGQVCLRRVTLFFPEATTQPTSDEFPVLSFVNDGLEWPAEYDATGWRLYLSPNLQDTSWQEVTGIVFADGTVRRDLNYGPPQEFYRLQKSVRP